jgi:alanyl-tRNA synthetase
VTRGPLRARDLVTASVDVARRDATRRNHTATHLLHAALRQVLGPHVKQAGSLVAPDRLRFDFVHFAPVTHDERQRIERIVAAEVLRNAPVNTQVKNTQEAIAAGATALFGEKYGETVRVVAIGDGGFSTELCGGTHVRATGDIGPFVITEESGVAAGVRRIEAVTGLGAVDLLQQQRDAMDGLLGALGVPAAQADDAVRKLQGEVKRLQRELQQVRTRVALGGGSGGGEGDRVAIGGATLVTRQVADVDKDALRSLADTLKSQLTSGVVVLAAPVGEGKVSVIAAVTPDLARKAPAGQLVKLLAPIVGGGGGGRPDFAEAGGKDAAKIPELLREARKLVEKLLTA